MKKKKVLSLLLVFTLVLGICASFGTFTVFADGEGDKVAQIGEAKFDTLAEAVATAENGDTITILKDFAISAEKTAKTDRIVIDKSVTIDFGTYTMSVPGSLEPTDNWAALYIDGAGVNVTLNATTGGIDCLDDAGEPGTYCFHLTGGATLTVNGGSYHGGGTIVNVKEGEAVINGGTFTATDFTDTYAGYRYVLNCIDANYANNTAAITVKGGTFAYFNPADNGAEGEHTNFVPEGYEVTNNNGTYTVTAPKPLQVGETKYDTLAEAIAAAEDVDTITLLADASLTSALTIPNGKAIVVDLNNKTLTVNSGLAPRPIRNNGTLTFENGSIVNTFAGTYGILDNYGTLYLTDVDVTEGEGDGGATFRNMTGGRTIVNGGTYTSTTASGNQLFRNHAYAADSYLEINDAVFESESSEDYPLVVRAGTAVFNGVTVAGASGAMCVDGASVTISNSNFTDTNASAGVYYAVYVSNSYGPSDVTINGGTFVGGGYDLLAVRPDGDSNGNKQNGDVSVTINDGTFTHKGISMGTTTNAQGYNWNITVLGGTFKNAPTAFVAEDYAAYENGDGTWTVVSAKEAQIGETKYDTLAEAIAAAEDDDTITILADVESTNGFIIDKTIALDTNGKTITVTTGANANNRAFKITAGTMTVYGGGTIVAAGAGTTTKNGSGCYGAFRVEANGKLIASDVTLTNARPNGLNVKVLGGEAELTNVTINSSYGGGIEVTEANLGTHSKPGTATLTNCTFTQTDYNDWCSTALSVSGGSELIVNSGSYTGEFAMYVFTSGGVITINDGTFVGYGNNNRPAIKAAIDTHNYPQYEGGLQIKGGTVTGALDITSPAYMVVTGGTFSADPTAFVADGYEAVPVTGGYQVGKVVAHELTPTTTEAGYDATYTATKAVVDDNETLKSYAEVTFNVKVVNDGENTAAEAQLSDVNVSEVLNSVLAETEVSQNDVVKVEIEIVRQEVAQQEPSDDKVTYEVHPQAIVTVNNEPAGTVEIANEKLAQNASFTIKLPVLDAMAVSGRVKVTHISEDYDVSVASYPVQGELGNYYVELTVTHFSKFEVEMDPMSDHGTATVTASLTLEDRVAINLYVTDLKNAFGGTETEPGRFKVRYTFKGVETTVTLTSATNNHIVLANCAAKEYTEAVTIVLIYDEIESSPFTYSVRDYCVDSLSNSSNQTLKDLCLALLEYGASAQERFEYNLDNMANEGYEGLASYLYGVDIPYAYVTPTFEPANTYYDYNVTSVSASLSLEAATELNVYFTLGMEYGPSNYNVYVNDQAVDFAASFTSTGAECRVKVTGIAAKDLDEAVKITVVNTDNDNGFTMYCSPLNYAYAMQSSYENYEDAQVSLALYLYNVAANAYFV